MSTTKAMARVWCVAIGVAMAWPAWGAARQTVTQGGTPVVGQTAGRGTGPVAPGVTKPGAPAPATVAPPPPGYVIGADDVLTIAFWRDKDMSTDVTVRPDGMISLLLVNEIQAAGLTPEALQKAITQAYVAGKFFDDPTINVAVKQINSRRVYITGQVGKPGPYVLTDHMTVLQLITVAGGLAEYAKKDNISVLRTVNGKPTRIKVNYEDLMDGKKLEQNIELKPGDQVIVP
jgi:polysaccharide export outer membrane protein